MTRRGLAVLIALTIISVSLPRVAEADPARLVYTRGPGAESCPDDAALRRAVATRLGHEPFSASADLTMSVEVTSEGGHLRGRIRVDAGGVDKGSQTIDGGPPRVGAPSCEDLFASMALAVSVALDAGRKAPVEAASEGVPAPPPASTPTPAPSPPPEPPPPAPVEHATRERQPISLWVAAGARLSIGAWPEAAVAPDLFAELRYGPFGLGLEGRYDLPVTVVVGSNEDTSVQRASGSLLPCAHIAWFVPCGVVTFGETLASGGAGVQKPTTQAAPYAAFGGRLGVDVKLVSRFHVLGTVDVVGIPAPPSVTVGQAMPKKGGPVEGSAGIALLVSIF